MATDRFDQLEVETSARPAGKRQPQEPAAEEAGSTLLSRAWYSFVSEDWLATVVGLILVVLIVVRFLHAIP